MAEAETKPEVPLASVLVPARNEEAALDGCLTALRRQSLERIEILVVDGGSTDATAAIAQSHADVDPRVRLISNPGRTTPRALNRGLEAARSPYLVRIDAHSTVPDDYVEKAVSRLEEGWAGVGGRKIAVAESAQGEAIATALSSRLGVGGSAYHRLTEAQPADHVPFGAYSVEVVRSLGGWDEQLPVNQDYELDYRIRRAGHELLLDPELQIDWQVPETLSGFLSQYHRYGRGKAQVIFKHPTSAVPRHLIPPAFVLALLTSPLLGVFGLRRVWWIPYPAYLSLIGIGSAVIASKRRLGWRIGLRLPPAFITMHLGWGAGFLRECLARVGIGKPFEGSAVREYSRTS